MMLLALEIPVSAAQDRAAHVHHSKHHRYKVVDLETGSGLPLADAIMIKHRAEIVWTGVLSSGDLHAVLLVPVDDKENANRGGGAAPGLSPFDVSRGTQRDALSRWSNQH